MTFSNNDRVYAELAIAEARKSKSELGKISPYVGAVAVRDGKLLGSAYRGELGEGDHAEYTLLEKKLKDEVVAGATVYTTLEPCTDRNHPKIECVARLIERKVARVIIGSLDHNPNVLGNGEMRLRDAGITVDRFPGDLVAQLEELNREFIRDQKKAKNEAISNEKNKPFQEHIESLINISGIWVCQYVYPKMDERLGKTISEIETQIVRFEQSGNIVKGETIYAEAHPERFEGNVINRYFTGLYFNEKNHHSYHGAFQYIISNSKPRMLGKWLGFNREGNAIETDEWRWDKLNDNPDIGTDTEHKYISEIPNINLFGIKAFL